MTFSDSDRKFVEDYFPSVNPDQEPLGDRILVQLKLVREQSKGGIVLVQETREVSHENNVVALVVAVGPSAYRYGDDNREFPEGKWVEVGDIVCVPKWGGFRFKRQLPNTDEWVTFCTFKDKEVITKVTGGLAELDQVL